MTKTRKGTLVHAAIASETGNVIGSPCQFKGVRAGEHRGMVMVRLARGDLRYFKPTLVHRVDECPKNGGAMVDRLRD